jgi:hypothetical protein
MNARIGAAKTAGEALVNRVDASIYFYMILEKC